MSSTPSTASPAASFAQGCPAPAEAPAQNNRRWRCIGLALGVLLVLTVTLWVGRNALLRGAAAAWVIDDPVEQAEVIVALPLVSGQPVVEAMRLYRERLGAKVVMVSAPPRPTDKLGLTTPHDEGNRRMLKEGGVPEADFLLLGQDVATAHVAAQTVAAWAKQNGIRSLTVVTEQFQSRRVKWSLEQAVRGSGVAVRVRAVPVRDYVLAEWWRNEQGLIHFENEVVLNLYYRWNY